MLRKRVEEFIASGMVQKREAPGPDWGVNCCPQCLRRPTVWQKTITGDGIPLGHKWKFRCDFCQIETGYSSDMARTLKVWNWGWPAMNWSWLILGEAVLLSVILVLSAALLGHGGGR